MPAFAGSLKIDGSWPCTPTPQQVATLAVKINVGYYITIENENDIVLTQDSETPTTYSGTYNDTVTSNFDCTLSASISSVDTGVVANGDLSVSITPTSISANTPTAITISVTAVNVHIESLPHSDGVQIATVTISAVPA
jgi:hypothetical protein